MFATFRNHRTSGWRAFFRFPGQLSQVCAESMHIFAYYPHGWSTAPQVVGAHQIMSMGLLPSWTPPIHHPHPGPIKRARGEADESPHCTPPKVVPRAGGVQSLDLRCLVFTHECASKTCTVSVYLISSLRADDSSFRVCGSQDGGPVSPAQRLARRSGGKRSTGRGHARVTGRRQAWKRCARR